MAKEITIGVSHTFNLGHFESMKVEASATFEVPGNKLTMERRIKAQEQLHVLIEDTLRAQPHSAMRQLLARIYAEKAKRETGEANERSSNEGYNGSC